MKRNNNEFSFQFCRKSVIAIGILFALQAVSFNTDAKRPKHRRLATFYYYSQDGLGGVSGRIMGNLIPVKSATVALMQNDKLIARTMTDEEGNFMFRYFNPGEYNIVASKEGFRTCSIIEIPVKEDSLTRTDFYMPCINTDHMRTTTLTEEYDRNRKFMREN